MNGIGIGGYKAIASKESPLEDNKLLETIPLWYDGQKLIQPGDYRGMLRSFSSWVYICASLNAVAFASVPIKLYVAKQSPKQKVLVKTKQVSKEIRKYMESARHASVSGLKIVRKAVEILEVEDHPLIDLIERMNPFMNRFDMLEMSNIHLELCGNNYWYIINNKLGIPAEIWTMHPDRVKIVPSREKWIKGYVYTTLDGKNIPFEPEEIIHFKFPHPSNYYYGMSPLEAMSAMVNINTAYDQYEWGLMKHNAVPPMALVAPKDSVISEDEFERIKERWNSTYGGPRNAGKVAFLEGGMDIKPLAFNNREMNYGKGRDEAMKQILAAFGVPMSKVTVDAVGRANADAGNYQYMSDTIQPRCQRFEDRLNESEGLTSKFDENLFLMFDNPVPDDEEFALKERESNLGAGLTSINEERGKIGMEPIEGGDIPYISQTLVPLGTPPKTPESGGGIPKGNEEAKAFFRELDGIIRKEIRTKILEK